MESNPEEEEIGRVEGLIVGLEGTLLLMSGVAGLWYLKVTFDALTNPESSILNELGYGAVALALFLIGAYLHTLWE